MTSIKAALAEEVGDPLYFPFEIGGRRPIRPMQGYLFKLPKAFIDLFGIASAPPPKPAIPRALSDQGLGSVYREADELASIGERDPFAVDPALVERGVRGHAVTQNLLAQHLRSLGIEPRSPRADEPNFDIAWRDAGAVFVAEIKSLTEKNQEKQLRLGLGQVLRYANQLGPAASAVLVAERCPNDPSWSQLCKRLGIILVWPELFAAVFPYASAGVAAENK